MLWRIHKMTILSLMLVASACGGGGEEAESELDPNVNPVSGTGDRPTVTPPADPNATPEQLFTTNVQPLLRTAPLNCAGCHEGQAQPNLLGAAGPEDDYMAAKNGDPDFLGGFDPGYAQILTKGQHSIMTTWYTPEQTQLVTQWLQAEYKAANPTAEVPTGDGGAGTMTPPSTNNLMAEWVGCMTKANWDQANMGEIANLETGDNDTCNGCHEDGQYFVYVEANNNTMFNLNRTYWGARTFFKVSMADGTAKVVPNMEKYERKCGGTDNLLHPSCDADQIRNRVQQFYDLTMQAKAAGQCGTPGYLPENQVE